MLTEEIKHTADPHEQVRRNDRLWIGIGAAFGLIAVIAGAAGTHAFRDTLDAGSLGTFETAVRFQMYHALALLAVGLLANRWPSRLIDLAGWLLTAGVLLFCGSLYILAITDIGVFGAVAPAGGLCLMAGWALIILGAIRRK
jgi:uncharacterized membrane protein YgdD (TMEM256/DUF423 family)